MNTKSTQLQVLGSGCPICKKFHKLVEKVAAELNPELKVEYSQDIQKIIDLGMMQSPVLVVNGKVALSGFTSDLNKIKKTLEDNI